MNETEASVVGMIFVDERVLDIYRRVGVREDWFTDEFYGKVFSVCCSLRDKRKTVDLVAVKDALGRLDMERINYSAQVTVSASLAETNAKVLKKAYTTRRLVWMLQTANSDALNGQDPDVVASGLVSQLEDLVKDDISNGIKSTYRAAEGVTKKWEEIMSGKKRTVTTGYSGLDRILGGGLLKGGFYVLAARPGGGKTALAVNITDRMAKAGTNVLFVTLEMSAEMLLARRLSLRTGIPAVDILNGNFSEDMKVTVLKEIPVVHKENIYYVDQAQVRVSDVVFYARSVKADVVVVDYLGLLTHEGGKTLYEKTTETSKRLKAAALDLDCPVLCLSQMNRSAEGDESPSPAKLRDSGQIEQDADGILLLHRKTENAPGVEKTSLDIVVGKNRHGALGKVSTLWDLPSGKIAEIAKEYDGYEPPF